MTSFRIRPRFQLRSDKSPEEIQTRIRSRLSDRVNCNCAGTVIPNHIVLRIPVTEEHYWSPQLTLNLEEDEEGTLIRGLYGPKPSVWTMFTFAYVALGVALTFILFLGLSRYSLGMDSSILWMGVIPPLLGLGLYVSSQMGQKMGAEQTFTIHHFLEETLDERVQIS